MASMHDSPAAPSFIASSTSFFISSSCAGVGRACELPMTHCQTVPRPTNEATLVEMPWRCDRVEVAAERVPAQRLALLVELRRRRQLALTRPGGIALAEDLGRDALPNLALGVAVFEEREIGMRVHVDEAGGDDQPLGVDAALGRAGGTWPSATMRWPRTARSP